MYRPAMKQTSNVPLGMLVATLCLLLPNGGEASSAYSEAMARYRAGDYEQAIRGLKQFLAEEPQAASAAYVLYLLGDTYATLGRADEAIDAFAQAGERYPSSKWATSATYRLGEIRASRQEWETAAEAYARFVELYLENHGDTVGGKVVSGALERIIGCHERLNPGRSRLAIQRDLVKRYEGYPVADAIVLAAGGIVLPPGSNLLRNPGFELDRGAMRLPPLGWEYVGTEPDPGDDADGTLDNSMFEGLPEARSGRLCVGKFTSYGTHRGWLFQSVPVVSGEEYECSAFCMVNGKAEATGRVRLGVDPQGGMEPLAPSVRWTEYEAPREGYRQIGFRGAKAVRATSERLTLFLEFRQDSPLPDNAMLFDDAEVRLLGQEKKTAG